MFEREVVEALIGNFYRTHSIAVECIGGDLPTVLLMPRDKCLRDLTVVVHPDKLVVYSEDSTENFHHVYEVVEWSKKKGL